MGSQVSDPKVVTETKQIFEGQAYYRQGKYFGLPVTANPSGQERRLHRRVIEAHYGPIPKGMHVHHINRDRSDNRLVNLALVTRKAHLAAHANDSSRNSFPPEAIAAAAAWHRSPEGRAWHKKHGRQTWKGRQLRRLTCAQCGQTFETRDRKASTRFCHQNCKAAARRARFKAQGLRADGKPLAAS